MVSQLGNRTQFLAGPYLGCADRLSSLEALVSALDNLDSLFESIDRKYAQSLSEDDIQRWDEKN
jgi:hypothetical protein